MPPIATPTPTDFIKATGIQKQREAMEEKLKLQTAKQKMRERVNPKVRPLSLNERRATFSDEQQQSLHDDITYNTMRVRHPDGADGH